MMGSQLNQTLKSLCCNTGWNYAVFWKLKHQAPMMLCWEDAYYDYCGPSENNWRTDIASICDAHFSHDHLRLAMAKMSNHVYSLGEGIVGQVAVTGKHMWISANKHVIDSNSFEYSDSWLTQFSAGIRTIAVVAVVGHGVLQLGSINNITEDLMLVDHIRDVYFRPQDPLAGYITSLDCLSCPTTVSSGSSASMKYRNCEHTLGKNMNSEHKPLDLSSAAPLPEIYLRNLLMTDKYEEPEYAILGIGERLNSCQSSSMGWLKEVTGSMAFEGEDRSGFGDVSVGSRDDDASFNFIDPRRTLYFGNESNYMDTSKACFNFSAGCELNDALGPSFKNQNTCWDWETPKSGAEIVVQIIKERMCSSNLTTVNPGAEHLLDAVVANACRSVSDVKHENTISGSATSLLTDAFSSSHNKCSKQMKMPKDFDKVNKKKSRPGENGKPRPRDRQLIQDGIKELRKLVPNGFKCSIDALLERTIKHLLFLRCTTKHADKLDKRANSKLLEKENAVYHSSSYEQGSSWAVWVGSELEVLPIIVENSNMSGQMTVEMLCDDCSTFFEIAEAIRSLDLIILKGTTEAYSGKILIRLLVEGQNNRNMHRMDILWSLIQMLQTKIEV